MCLYFHNSILIATICLAFSFVYAQSSKDPTEIRVNMTQSVSNENKMTHLAEEKQQLLKADEKDISKLSFLTKDSDLSILNIPFVNNEKNINVLKSATNSIGGGRNTSNHKKPESGTANEFAYNGSFFSVEDNKTNMANLSNVKAESTQTSTPQPDLFKKGYFYIAKNNEESPVNSPTSNKTSDQAMIHNDEKKQLEVETVRNQAEPLNNRKSVNKELEISNNTETIKESKSQMPANEINLSELTNLSYDGEEMPVGQKIDFQSSETSSENGNRNQAGAEILKLTSRTCGYFLGKRISFAEPTTLMEFPWTALLLYNTRIRYHCGGSLITTKYVLTAAHCVAQEFFELIGVRLGEHDITEEKDCAPDLGGGNICASTVDADVVKIIVHHGYSHLSFKNDIALLRLDNDYSSRSYYPICLPTPEMMYTGKSATVAGWGATEKALRSAVLLKAEVPIFDVSKCREIYRYNVFNDSTEICAAGSNEVDVCKGDSGGAIFYTHNIDGRDKFYQLGIISLGVRRCGDSRFLPAVFTKLSSFYKWIETKLEN